MDDLESLEARLRATQLRTSKALDARIQALLDEAEVEAPSAQRWSLTWVLRNRIWRSVAVAAAAALVVVGVTLLGRSAPMTLADVQKALEAQKVVHMKVVPGPSGNEARTDLQRGVEVQEVWVSFAPQRTAIRLRGGKAYFDDAGQKRAYDYEPETDTLTVKPRSERPTDSAMSPLALFKQSFEMWHAQGCRVTRRTEERHGRTMEVIEVNPADTARVVLVCDRQTQLPAEMESWTRPDKDAEFALVARTFLDYPATGPTSIYDLGVPRSAKVDRSGIADENVLMVLNEYERHREEFAPLYQLIVLWGKKGGGQLVPGHLTVYVVRKQEATFRFDSYKVPGKAVFEMREVIQTPDDLPKLEGLLTQERLVHSLLRNRTTTYEWSQGTGKVERRFFQGRAPLPSECVEELAWPEVGTRGRSVRLIESEGDNGNLLCVQRTEQGSVYRDDQGAIAEVFAATRTRFWLNPERNSIAELQQREWRRLPDWQEDQNWLKDIPENKQPRESWLLQRITQYAQTPGGQWYPKEVEVQGGTYTSDGRRVQDSESVMHIHLQIPESFPKGTFDPAALGNAPQDAPEVTSRQ